MHRRQSDAYTTSAPYRANCAIMLKNVTRGLEMKHFLIGLVVLLVLVVPLSANLP
jgi:hypothetical protein